MRNLVASAAIAASLGMGLLSGLSLTSVPLEDYERADVQSPQVTSTFYQYEVECPNDKSPLGGGFSLTDYGDNDIKVVHSSPQFYTGFKGWAVAVENLNGNPLAVAVYVTCATV